MSEPTAGAAPGARLGRFLVWWQAFLALTGYITGAGILAQVLSPDVAALCLVINGGLNQATGVLIARGLPQAMQQAASERP